MMKFYFIRQKVEFLLMIHFFGKRECIQVFQVMKMRGTDLRFVAYFFVCNFKLQKLGLDES